MTRRMLYVGIWFALTASLACAFVFAVQSNLYGAMFFSAKVGFYAMMLIALWKEDNK